MINYNITAINANGKEVSEIISAENPAQLVQAIKNRGLFLIDYRELSSATTNIKRLKLKSLVVYCRQAVDHVTCGDTNCTGVGYGPGKGG